MSSMSCSEKAACVMALVAMIAAAAAIAVAFVKSDNTTGELEQIRKQIANLTDRKETEREEKIRFKEVTQLKQDYMKLVNQTINYTNNATIQRALNELKDVKETQRSIQKKLQELLHLNDTAEDYLNLVESVHNLTTQVNQNITRLEEMIKYNRDEWRRVLNANTSGIKSDISSLKTRFDEFEKAQNKINTTNEAGLLSQRNVFYTLTLLTTFGAIIVNV